MNTTLYAQNLLYTQPITVAATDSMKKLYLN